MVKLSDTVWASAGPAADGHAIGAKAAEIVPAGLLDGGEVVVLAVKPSLWFIVLRSGNWVAACALLAAAAWWTGQQGYSPQTAKLAMQTAVALAMVRITVAMFQWASRLYVLTNRRVMRIKGVLHVEVFECPLEKIQNTFLSFSLPERLVRVGSLHILTAGTAGIEATWQHIAQPVEVHRLLREAIAKASRGQPKNSA